MTRPGTWRQNGLLILFLASIFGPVSLVHAAIDDMNPIHFAVIGDRAGAPQGDVYEQIVTEVSRLRPDLVMTVGDMIEGYTDDSTELAQRWQDYRYLISPMVAPIHFTPGNNELFSSMSERAYRENVGRTYYSFNYDKVHFVVIDNSRWETSNALPAEELEWLARDLKMFKSSYYTVVFMHKPFWWETIVYNAPDTLHQLFKAYGVDAVFSGHFHQYFSADYDGIKYTCVGSSGADMGDDFGGLGYHYLWVTVDYRGIHVAPIRTGNVKSWEEMSIADRKIYDCLRRHGLTFSSPVLVSPDLTLANTTLTFTVDNSVGNYPVVDTVKWQTPAGWKIHPRQIEINVPPHGTRAYTVTVSCKGEPFPAPWAEIDFTYAKDRMLAARTLLPLTRTAYCYPVSTPPIVDGVLDEEVWKHPEGKYYDPNGAAAETEPTEVFFSYDADHLYIGAVCRESQPDAIRVAALGHDGAVYGDDCIGFFLSPGKSNEQAYQVYFNAAGVAFDQKLLRDNDGYMDGDQSWNGIYDVKTGRTAEGWTLEACVPLAQFGGKLAPGDEWRINFRRKQARLGKAADWQTPVDSDPQSFGVLVAK